MQTRVIDPNDPFSKLDPPTRFEPPAKETPPTLGSIFAQPAPIAVTQDVQVVASEANKVDLTVNSPSPGPAWTRQDLPSLQTPYDIREIFMQPVTVPVLSMLHAAHVNASLSLLIDAVDQCVSVDCRSLTPEDFNFVMYWVRDNSYPKTPQRIPYKTRYNNEITINLLFTNLKITELNMTRAEYLRDWKSKGIVFPTMRDAELISKNEEVADDLQWMLEFAQYVEYVPGVTEDGKPITDYSDYVERKFEKLNNGGVELIAQITKFRSLIAHGVQETITIVDSKFDPVKAAEDFEAEASKITMSLNNIPAETLANSTAGLMYIINTASELITEAKEIRKELAAGRTVKPREEVVPVTITATDFFPYL